jgi:hypothetical protein
MLASRLGLTLDEVMERTTSRQFLLWRIRFVEEKNEMTPTLWYLARIAMEIVQGRTRRRLTLKQFVLESKKEPTVKAKVSRGVATAVSKAFWMSLASFGVRQPPKQEDSNEQ